MLNQVVLVGRIVKNIDADSKYMTIAVSRSFKNENGEYETELIDVYVKGHIANATKEYCHKGDLVGTWFPDRQYKGKSCILPLIYNINLTIYHNLLFVNK